MDLRIAWGVWDRDTGRWTPNDLIDRSAERQHLDNLENGFSCLHRYKPGLCPQC